MKSIRKRTWFLGWVLTLVFGGVVNDPKMKDARATVFAACKANHIAFLNSLSADGVIDMIKEGIMVGPASQQTAEIGANSPTARCRGKAGVPKRASDSDGLTN